MNSALKLLRLAPFFFLIFMLSGCGKGSDFKVTEWNDDYDTRPIIFYLSGDAGFNTFSKNLGRDLHNFGYDVFALDTKSYFWSRKTPVQTSADVEKYINRHLKGRKNKKVIIIGFSFGADVTAFVYNRFTPDLKNKIEKVFIIGPSKSNDFKIHLTEYFGEEFKGSFEVIPEINRMKGVPLTLVLSDYEFAHFPYNEITLNPARYQMVHIHGDHHYGGNTEMLAGFLHQHIPK